LILFTYHFLHYFVNSKASFTLVAKLAGIVRCVAANIDIFGSIIAFVLLLVVVLLNRMSTQRSADRPFSPIARDPDATSPTLTEWNRESA